MQDTATPSPEPAPVGDVTAILEPFLGNMALFVTLAVIAVLAVPAALAVRRITERR